MHWNFAHSTAPFSGSESFSCHETGNPRKGTTVASRETQPEGKSGRVEGSRSPSGSFFEGRIYAFARIIVLPSGSRTDALFPSKVAPVRSTACFQASSPGIVTVNDSSPTALAGGGI